MADKKISQLTDLPAASVAPSNDVLAIVDTSATETKKVTAKALVDGALNAGTANGLVYLNGSKETTTGSIITYDGTTFGVDDAVVINESGGDNDTRIEGDTDANLFFVDASTDRIGIGTNAPGAKLTVNDANGIPVRVGDISSAPSSQTAVYVGASTSALSGGNGDLVLIPRTSDARSILFYTGNGTASLRATLDSSGNLGLGVTPSAWSTAGKNMQFGNGPASIGTQNSGDANFMHNAYESPAGTFKYASSGIGSLRYQLDINNNAHKWYSAPSGTAGNTITFTQAMTLDASGNLGVGTTSPSALGLQVTKGSGVAAGLLLSNAANNWSISCGASTNALIFTDNQFAERARITSGGKLLVATTSNAFDANLLVYQATATNDTISVWNAATSGDNQFIEFYTEGNGTGRGLIDYNRGAGLTRYNTTSDYRAKDIIGPLQNVGETIDGLKVYEGIMKGATESRPMLIAHEAQEYAPYAVSGVKDQVNEDGTPKYQQIDVSSLVPLMLAEIQSLRARVAALEAK